MRAGAMDFDITPFLFITLRLLMPFAMPLIAITCHAITAAAAYALCLLCHIFIISLPLLLFHAIDAAAIYITPIYYAIFHFR